MNYTDSTLLIVGNVPQYFFDNLVIAQTQDIKRTIHSPEKVPDPRIRRDRPWEVKSYFTVNSWSVLRDSRSDQFRCWYEDFHVDPDGIARTGTFNPYFSATCYAESTDGVRWEKPELEYYVKDGNRTNVVIGDPVHNIKCEGIGVFEDPLEKNPDHRFKGTIDNVMGPPAEAGAELNRTRDASDGLSGRVRMEIHSSADGLAWTPFAEELQFGRHGPGLGDCFTIFPDVDSGVYRLITRAAGMESIHYPAQWPRNDTFFPPNYPHDPARMNKRRIYVAESSDLVHWTRPQCILSPDPQEDNLDEAFYGMCETKLGEIYVGFVNTLQQVDNTMNVRLAYSRDGWRWYFLNQRRPWLSTNPGAWDSLMVNISSPPIPVDSEHHVYYGGSSGHHDWWIMGKKEGLNVPDALDKHHGEYCLGLAKFRRDGFVSLDAGPVREGVWVTHALRPSGRALILNAVCGKNGYIRVEATDADDNVLDGCSVDACDTFTGDNTRHRLSWKGRSDIPYGETVRLRFWMRDASVYSFQFQ